MEKFVTLKKTRRKRKHGFLSRMSSHTGRKVISRRQKTGRRKITV